MSAAAQELPSQSPADWEQIEDEREVKRVLSSIARTTRMDVFRCAELYELAYPGYEGDSDFYVEQAQEGRALYLGVGTGRIFSKIAASNPRAVGIEKSPQMLALFERRHPGIAKGRIMLGDAADAELPESSFDTVVAPYSFLQLVEQKSLPRVLKNVHDWLRPGGRFFTDTFSPYIIPFRRPGLETSERTLNDDVRIAIYVLYDHVRQRMKEMALVSSNGDTRALEMNLHYYFPRELTTALKKAGFSEPAIHGGYQGEPFDPTANEVLVYEARKPSVPRATGRDSVL